MEAAFNDSTKENVLNSMCLNKQVKLSDYRMAISPMSFKNIKNIDVVILINDLHRTLDDDYETGIQINHLGKKVTFYIDHISFRNASMIYFKGQTENGKLVHFVKHLPDLNILLMPLKRRVSNQLKIPFGFADWDDYETEKSKKELD